MGHYCAAILYVEDEDADILEKNIDYAYDYYTRYEDDDSKDEWYKGLILKDGKENEYMYTAYDGKRYSYKASVDEIDWMRTFEESSIFMFIDYRIAMDSDDFDSKEEFREFFFKRIKNAENVELVDVHM